MGAYHGGTRLRMFLAGLLLAFAWQRAAADSWPMYRHDAHRSTATAEQLAPPLKLSWSYTCPQPPAPAWPDTFPLSILNRLDFDYAPQLAVAEGIVCFGSSADDTIRALDARTGREKWHFIAGGPVRFAPQIVSNRVYFAADDGYVYCLNAQTGRGIWKLNLAPSDERFLGNHRMISCWPIRTGVLVADGVLYAVAGMWPAEGVFCYALQADTGKIIWCNDTLGGTPQGALLLSGDVLLIPNGNARTTPLNRRTGELMRWGSSNEPPGWLAGTYQYIPADPRTGALATRIYRGGGTGRGGTWVTVDDDKEYSLVQHRAMEVHIEPNSLTNGLAQRGWPIRPQLFITAFRPGDVHARGKVSAIVHKGRTYTRQAYGMALAGTTLFLGLDGAVTAESTVKADTNIGAATTPWQAKVDGEAHELAVSDGRLFVATSEGVIYAFAPGQGVDAASSPRALPGAESGKREVEKSEIRNPKSEIIKDSNRTPPAISHQPSTINHLRSAGMDRGFALVLGDDAGQMSLALAAQTHLQVINALTNAAAAAALRERLLAQTPWYGSRIHVQTVARLDRLPFAQFFANAVIVAGPTPGLSGKELYRVLRPCGGILLSPGLGKAEAEALVKECDAYEAASHAQSLRVTTEPTPPFGHPSKEGTARNDPLQRRGGPDASRPQESRDDRDRGGFPFFVRGQLSGALDWDTAGQIKLDQRVQWPLRHLWFGGPATRQVQEIREKGSGPILANGRSFYIAEDLLTAVDAYNGAVLWSRPIPKGNYDYRSVAGALYKVSDKGGTYGRPQRGDMIRSLRVSDDYVYLTLRASYFKGKGQGTIQLDARSGEQKQVKVPFNPPVPVSLKTPQSWPLEVDANHSGTLAMAATAQGLVLTLSTVDALVTPLDSWELFFDFRPPEARYGLYEQGAFRIRVIPALDKDTPASWSPITVWSSRDPTAVAGENGPRSPSAATAGSAMPASVGRHSMTASSVTVPPDSTTPLYLQLQVSGTREASGTKITVTLPWIEIEKLTGARPENFDFAAALNAYDGLTNEPIIQRRYLFGDWTADGLNNGWAAVALGAAVPQTNQPAIMTAASNDKQGNGAGIYAGYSVNIPQILPPRNYSPGTHPLTGESVPKIYWWDPVCGAPEYSAHLVAGRAGVFDMADNSGARVLPLLGIKPGCSTPVAAALGMLVISEETGHCVCNYPFRTTLALAPAERPLNEDWGRFYERDVDTLVRQAHINFGAPGDRRDAQGNLWLRFPRADTLTTPEEHTNADHPLAYPVGMRDSFTGLWYHRALRNAIWVPLEVETLAGFEPYRFNTDRFAIRGTERPWIYGSGYRGIRRAALKLNFFKPLAARSVSAPLTVDGKLDESAWQPEMADTNAPPLLPYTATRVFFRYDQRALYLGVQRPPMAKVTATKQANAVALFSRELRPWQTGRSKPDEVAPQDNWWRLIVSDRSLAEKGSFAAGKRPPVLHFTVTADGTRAEALGYPPESQLGAAHRGTNAASGGTDVVSKALDWNWNAPWESAGVADPAPGGTGTNGWTLEMAIPFSTLEQAGLKREQLALNFVMNDPGIGTEALTYLGLGGADNCSNFTPLGLGALAASVPRAFTVRLHFAEPDLPVRTGQRVFDVKLQGQTVLKGFDIVKEAGASRTALVKEFRNVRTDRELVLELVPFARSLTPESVPVLSGLELLEQAPAAGGAVQRGPGAGQK